MPVAEMLAARGIRALVQRYRLLPTYGLDEMLEDLGSSVDLVRSTHRGPVAAIGFSAGGHLVASLSLRTAGTPENPPAEATSSLAAEAPEHPAEEGLRPLDAQVLIYPCIDGSDWADPESCGFSDFRCSPWSAKFAKAQSLLAGREALLGGPGFAAPPTFLVASTRDEACPPRRHTDVYASTLRRKHVPYTYMRQNFGDHGFGIQGGWTDKCVAWLQDRGFGGVYDQ